MKSRANHLHIGEVKDHLASPVFAVVVHDMWMVCVTLLMFNMCSLQCRLFQGRSLYNNDMRSGTSK